MVFQRLISFLCGYVVLLVRGPHLEKIVNLLTNSGLYLWDVRRLGAGVIQLKIRAHGFLRIREYVRKTRSTVKIHRKKGLPFLWRRVLERKMLFIGGVALVLLIVYLSSFIFFIKIEGFEGAERQKLLLNLARLGLKSGIKRSDFLDKKSLVERDVMINTPEAVWLSITVQGVVAEVKVVKRKTIPVPMKTCDIVAAKDGVVTKLVVVRGIPVVKEGDSVAKGDLLISGIEWLSDPEAEELIKKEVTASGIVEARVWNNFESIEPKIVWRSYVRGSKYVELKLRWGKKVWWLGHFGKKPVGSSTWVRWRRPIFTQGRNPSDIVELIKDTWQTINWRRVSRSQQDIVKAAIDDIQPKLKSLKTSAVTTQLKTWSEEGNFIKLVVTTEAIEDISRISFSGKGF